MKHKLSKSDSERVLTLSKAGLTSSKIANMIGMSPKSLETELRIKRKLQILKNGKLVPLHEMHCDECGELPSKRDKGKLEDFKGKKVCSKCLCPEFDMEEVRHNIAHKRDSDAGYVRHA